LNFQRLIVAGVFLFLSVSGASASSGATGAAFLGIPVGAGPAALGAAYSALATDAYAPTWNPAGLGFVDAPQFAGQHISYLETSHDEYASLAYPFRKGQAFGLSAQYFGSGDIPSTGNSGQSLGSFSNHYAAFTLAYGAALTERLSLGVAPKWVNAQLGDFSANAYAVDAGAFFKASGKLDLAVVMANAGSKLTFISQDDSLPLEVRFGGAGRLPHHVTLSMEGVYRPNDVSGGHFGVEWSPADILAFRAGYRTDTTKDLSAVAGFTTGVGLRVWGQEFAYAWTPMGDLGDVHYFSSVVRFGSPPQQKHNLIGYKRVKSARVAQAAGDPDSSDSQLLELLESSKDGEGDQR